MLPGHKHVKEMLTLFKCGNASGDFKVKTLWVYHSDNPRVPMRNYVLKSKLSVMWRSNARALVTRRFITEWMHEVGDPRVKKYLKEKRIAIEMPIAA